MQLITNQLRYVFAAHRDLLALHDCIGGESLTYGQLEDISSKLAKQLSRTVCAGGRVVLLLPNSTAMVASYLACFQGGFTSVPINADFHAAEIAAIIALAKPDLVVTDASTASRLPEGLDVPILLWGRDITLETIGKHGRMHGEAFALINDDNLAHIVFSSGSTGMPKAIPIRFGRIVGHAAMFARTHGLSAQRRFYNVLPLAYLGGWYNMCLVPFMAGGCVVLDKVFGNSGMYRFWGNVVRHKVDCLWFTPSMLSALLSIGLENAGQGDEIRRSIRWAMVGMAPLMVDVKQRFEAMFGFRLQQSYGLSETFLFTSWQSDVSLPDCSVGKVLEGYEVRIGAQEEIQVKSAWVMDGYWEQEHARACFDDEGYFKTGDAGHFDAAGNLFITGRIKDIIIRGGINISPAEIEAALHRMVGVRQAAVIGVADALYGEKIVAFVTGDGLTPASVKAFCRIELSALKLPSDIRILEYMPLNASGRWTKNT